MAPGVFQKKHIKAIEFPHFPTLQQAIVWRNWEMVPVNRIAKILQTNEESILQSAEDMGLNVPPKINKYWLERGYITLIRQNWQLLTYEQILILLDWTDEKLQFTLKEDDFLYHKLGMFKPDIEQAVYKPLSEKEKAETRKISEILSKHFPTNYLSQVAEPFDFLNNFINVENNINIQESENVSISSMQRLYKFAYRFSKKMEIKWNIKLEINDAQSITGKTEENELRDSITISSENLKILINVKPDQSLPSESHEIEIEDKVISIMSVDENGVLRGLQWLEKQIDVKEDSFIIRNSKSNSCQSNLCQNNEHLVGRKTITRKTRFELRYIYSYFAVYGDPLSDPKNDPYPEGLLASLSEMGVNGVWLQGVLYSLVPWDKVPELSTGWEKRIEGLRNIVKRAADYGIGVYLYFNEPRAMPKEFFDKYPEWRGSTSNEITSLCTSHKDIQDYLRNSIARLFTEVPDLAGLFTITMSENHTNCYSHTSSGNKPDCPLCSKRSQAEVIAEVNNILAEGAHSVKADARVIAWMWGWHPDWSDEAISLLNKDVMVMCTSEEAMPTNIAGIKGQVIDYTMSIPSPGQRSINNWKKATASGHKAMAKVQFNNTWECSAVPYLPVMDLLHEYVNGLSNSGVTGMQLSWTLGGYPSLNLEFASQLYWDEENSTNSGIEDFAVRKYGVEAAPYIIKAWSTFSDAFREFPFHISVLYTAPQNYGPMNLLHEKPTGYRATMIGFPYDDLNTWRAIYSEDIFEKQFNKLSEKWKEGLKFVEQAKSSLNQEVVSKTSPWLLDLENVSTAAYCHFRSTYLQIRFVRLRNELLNLDDYQDNTSIIKEIIAVIEEEIQIAKLLYDIIKKDSRIGYEASNHYYYTDRDLKEKIINCEYLKEKYLRMLK